eukprot:227898-Chlamydomonas_euryale.AAC.1
MDAPAPPPSRTSNDMPSLLSPTPSPKRAVSTPSRGKLLPRPPPPPSLLLATLTTSAVGGGGVAVAARVAPRRNDELPTPRGEDVSSRKSGTAADGCSDSGQSRGDGSGRAAKAASEASGGTAGHAGSLGALLPLPPPPGDPQRRIARRRVASWFWTPRVPACPAADGAAASHSTMLPSTRIPPLQTSLQLRMDRGAALGHAWLRTELEDAAAVAFTCDARTTIDVPEQAGRRRRHGPRRRMSDGGKPKASQGCATSTPSAAAAAVAAVTAAVRAALQSPARALLVAASGRAASLLPVGVAVGGGDAEAQPLAALPRSRRVSYCASSRSPRKVDIFVVVRRPGGRELRAAHGSRGGLTQRATTWR